jgi:hypothetical protein
MVTSRQPPAASTADAFDQSHQGRMRSAVVEQIYRSAFGEDYPAGAHPSAFYSAAHSRHTTADGAPTYLRSANPPQPGLSHYLDFQDIRPLCDPRSSRTYPARPGSGPM